MNDSTAVQTIQPVFSFGDHKVRVITLDGEPWFVATDVADALGYSSPKDAAEHLDVDEKGSAVTRTPGGDQRVTIINESGLYALVLRSRKPEARKFAKWVTSEVLPAIRKTGGYAKPTADAEWIQAAYRLASHVAAIAAHTVFDAVLAEGDARKHDRWMFHIDWHTRDGNPAPCVKPIEGNAMVVSMADLPRRLLEPNGMLPTNKELADLAAACNQRLAQRMTYEANKAAGTGVMKP